MIFIFHLTDEEQLLLKDYSLKNISITPDCELVIRRKQPFVQVRFQPIRWNADSSVFEKLSSFNLVIQVDDQPERR